MTKATIKAWLDTFTGADQDSDEFETVINGLMSQAEEFCKEPGIDLDLYVDLCNLQWLWKHLKDTDYDVGAGADENYPVFFIMLEIADKMLGRIDGFYEFN